jgi:bifunctional non-homologous end joining protein LigD
MDRLSRYRGKRDATRTPEPVPPDSTVPASTGDVGPGPSSGGRTFVIQEHHARRLHWDFRLERDGVLVSWALPKGVPDDPAANHLAVHTEDHPLEYAGFEGQIPRGEYGGGAVTIWDHGTYELVKWDEREVKVVLHGERLSGGYTLFRTGRPSEEGKDWLIHRERLPLPAGMRPMLASAGRFPAWEAAAWAVEVKWDGVRALAFIEAGRLTLRSRTGKDITVTYPELAGIPNAIGHRQVLLDGEVAVLNAAGQPDFEALQSRIHVSAPDQALRLAELTPVSYLAFDLLQLDGRLLVDLPYSARRELLTALSSSGIGVPPVFPGTDFDAVLGASLAHGLEGVVAKRLDSRYEPGARSDNWVKVKNLRRQEVVVAGWKPGKGNREGHVGSLLMGVYHGGALIYCGHVGTGFTVETLTMLDRRLAPLRRDRSPFGEPIPEQDARSAVWVEPSLVAEVVFERWTRSGRMRAPAYKGLRDDKAPGDVVREDWGPQEDQPAVADEAPPVSGEERAPSPRPHDGVPRDEAVPGGAEMVRDNAAAPGDGTRAPGGDKIPVRVDGRTLTLTNLSKVLYPADGFAKAEVLDYYQRISPVLLPHLAGRPLTLKRFPNGVDGQSFFQKHAPPDTPDWVRIADVESRSSRGQGGVVRHIVIDDLATLIWAANRAALELHAPMWRIGAGPKRLADPEGQPRPDLLVFDLDPGEPATIVECCRVAEALRPLLAEAGLTALPKTSGGKGLQLYARVQGVTAVEASDQARHFARALEHGHPDLVTSRMTKSLRPGKVLVDWSQNNGSKTTVVPYSLRARTHPTVSTPVTWDEVAACARPADLVFTAADVPDRVAALGDLWESLR